VYTPVKRKKERKYLSSADNYFSQLISKARQAIEAFFNRLNEKTRIQAGSKVRSVMGLLLLSLPDSPPPHSILDSHF
jgi:hypothetical protein